MMLSKQSEALATKNQRPWLTAACERLLQTLKNIRSCLYDAILNCEQRSLAGSAFLALIGAAYHIGFIFISDTPKGRP